MAKTEELEKFPEIGRVVQEVGDANVDGFVKSRHSGENLSPDDLDPIFSKRFPTVKLLH